MLRARADNRRPSAREEARALWNVHPAGTTLTDQPWHTPEFFEQMRATRYELQDWHPALLADYRGTRLLEIGCGAGTDLTELAQNFKFAVGLDLTPSGARLAKGALEYRGRRGATVVADGTALPFRPGAFDLAYSFGVLHHADHPEKAVDEIFRVLQGRGHVVIGLYHRWSLFALGRVFRYVLGGTFRTQSWANFIAGIEAGAREQGAQPTVRLYSRRQARLLLRGFADVRTRIFHYGSVIRLGRPVERILGRLAGWYVIVEGDR